MPAIFWACDGDSLPHAYPDTHTNTQEQSGISLYIWTHDKVRQMQLSLCRSEVKRGEIGSFAAQGSRKLTETNHRRDIFVNLSTNKATERKIQLKNTTCSSHWWHLDWENTMLNELSDVGLMHIGRYLRGSWGQISNQLPCCWLC